MVKCTNCGAKHYDGETICCNCNSELVIKARKAHDVYCLATDYTVTTKRLTEKFLSENLNEFGFVELLKNYTESVTMYRGYNGDWKVL